MLRASHLIRNLALVLLLALPAVAQLTTVTGSNVGAGNQPAGIVWTLCFAPTGVPGKGFHVGSTGQATGQGICRDVENGVILTTLRGTVLGPMQVADTSLSAPENLCYVVTLRDDNGNIVLGGAAPYSGYGCVQPSGATFNFDTYIPNEPAIPLGQSIADLIVENLTVSNCTGCGGGLPSGTGNQIVATPNGSSGTAALRSMVPADVPALPESAITNLSSDLASKLSASLTSAYFLVGNGSNVATGVAMSGDCGLSNAGAITCSKAGGVAFGALATLAPGSIPSGYTIPWGQVTSQPSILSPTLTSAYFFVGNGSNVATGVAMSGDCGLSNAGAITCSKAGGVAFGALATLAPGSIPSGYTIPWGQVTSQPSILSPTLTSTYFFVGNGSNVATGVAMSGDCGLSNAGAITCSKTGGVAFGTFATLSAANLQNTTQFPSSTEERDFFGGYFGSYLRGAQANIESGANFIAIVNYFGDSMTRGDGLTSVVRNYLQTDWFDGGPGWCSANYTYGAVWPADCQLTADTGSGVPAGTWTDCVHGAGGSGCTSSYTANGPDLMTTISNDTSTPAAKRITCEDVDQIQLWYVQQPNGGSFEYTFDAAGEATTVSTAGSLSLKVLDWATIHGSAIGNGTHYVNFKITVAGSGSTGDACQGSNSGAAQTCILGAYCINDIGGGAVVNKLGATGSEASSWTQFITNNTTMFAAELSQLQTYTHTAVVSNVFMDGANDLVANVTPATLSSNTSTLVNYLQTNYPNADEWIASEPDNGTTGLTYTMGAYAHAQQDLARSLSNGSACFPSNGITTQAQCVGYLGHYENMWNYDRDCILGLMAAGSPCDLTHPSTAGYGLLANMDKVYLTGGHRPSFESVDLVFTFNPATETPTGSQSYFWGLNNYPGRTGANNIVAWIPRKNCVLHKIQYGQSLQTVDAGNNNWTFELCTGGNTAAGSCASSPSALSDTIQTLGDGVNASFATYSVKDLLSPSSSYLIKTTTSSSIGSAANWTPVAIGYCRVVGY